MYRSDDGGEFIGGDFQKICDDEGNLTEIYEPDAHHQNGVAERTHCTITDGARALMIQADILHYLWEYACVVLIPPEQRSMEFQLRPKARTGIFIGSDPQRKGYFVYVIGRGHRVVHSRCVVFLEPPTSQQLKGGQVDDPLAGSHDGNDSDDKSADNDLPEEHNFDDNTTPRTVKGKTGICEVNATIRTQNNDAQEVAQPLRRSA
ncbi:unnamed protein product [Phytophthora fragariaefolia]|uniref:Unnamed protein product n=1 Tax=Phytophthora fragariaefolia TaxID=1490495 RepID=A0A9W6WS73_9STRA|nr:unnamed protein product [Phytophthora fragariaefolia]